MKGILKKIMNRLLILILVLSFFSGACLFLIAVSKQTSAIRYVAEPVMVTSLLIIGAYSTGAIVGVIAYWLLRLVEASYFKSLKTALAIGVFTSCESMAVAAPLVLKNTITALEAVIITTIIVIFCLTTCSWTKNLYNKFNR
jgi:hypothetical protein